MSSTLSDRSTLGNGNKLMSKLYKNIEQLTIAVEELAGRHLPLLPLHHALLPVPTARFPLDLFLCLYPWPCFADCCTLSCSLKVSRRNPCRTRKAVYGFESSLVPNNTGMKCTTYSQQPLHYLYCQCLANTNRDKVLSWDPLRLESFRESLWRFIDRFIPTIGLSQVSLTSEDTHVKTHVPYCF